MKDGYYWVDLQDGEGERIVEIVTHNGPTPIRFVLFMGTDLNAELDDYDSVPGIRWVGPLESP
jgi:hypothetical protein